MDNQLGVIFTLRVAVGDESNNLERTLKKGRDATITIPEIDFEV